MDFSTPEDPELQRQQDAASADKIDAIRQRVSQDTMQSLRLFGSRWAMSGQQGVPILK